MKFYAVFGYFRAGIMAGYQNISSEFTGFVCQQPQLNMPVAQDAGRGGESLQVRRREVVDDIISKFVF